MPSLTAHWPAVGAYIAALDVGVLRNSIPRPILSVLTAARRFALVDEQLYIFVHKLATHGPGKELSS